MIKNKKLLLPISIVLLMVIGGISLLTASNKPVSIPGLPQKCGIENCHGMEITCGSQISKICTEEYMLGDKCRQYASCQVIQGKCQLVKNKKFDACKTCVESCLKKFSEDPIELFRCEGGCGE